MKKSLLISFFLTLALISCIPGTRSARVYQDKMTGKTVIESGDARLSTDTIGQNIYVGYIAHILPNGDLDGIVMEVTYNYSDWSFYNECWLKIDDGKIIKKTGIVPDSEIIGSYNLMERGRFPITKKTLLAIANSSSGLIRTIGPKGYAEGEINESLRAKTRDFCRKIKLIK